MGKMIGDYAVQLITEADKAETVRVIISGMPSSPSDVDREAGIREALSVLGDKVEIETVFPPAQTTLKMYSPCGMTC